MQAALGLCWPLTESVGTVDYVEEQKMPRLDCTDAHADLDLRCPQIARKPFSCVSHQIVTDMFTQNTIFSCTIKCQAK